MERRDNVTYSFKDKGRIDNTTGKSHNSTFLQDKKRFLGDAKNCSANTASVEDKQRTGNASEPSVIDNEWIQNSTKIFERMMENYDASIAPHVPGM